MIKDWNAHNLWMDFSNVDVPSGRPSDIDFFYIVPEWIEYVGGFLILGEIKNSQGRFTDEQRRLYIQLINNHKQGGVLFYITHNKMWQDGDRKVDVAYCQVEQYYYHNMWRTPKQYSTVNDMIRNIINYERQLNEISQQENENRRRYI